MPADHCPGAVERRGQAAHQVPDVTAGLAPVDLGHRPVEVEDGRLALVLLGARRGAVFDPGPVLGEHGRAGFGQLVAVGEAGILRQDFNRRLGDDIAGVRAGVQPVHGDEVVVIAVQHMAEVGRESPEAWQAGRVDVDAAASGQGEQILLEQLGVVAGDDEIRLQAADDGQEFRAVELPGIRLVERQVVAEGVRAHVVGFRHVPAAAIRPGDHADDLIPGLEQFAHVEHTHVVRCDQQYPRHCVCLQSSEVSGSSGPGGA